MIDVTRPSRRVISRRCVISGLVALASASMLLGLGACGKRGSLSPAEGEESDYNYPGQYPPAETVTPAPPASRPNEESEDDTTIRPFGSTDRTTSTIYGGQTTE